MRTTVAKLITDAIDSQKNTTASNGRWKCRINKDVDAYIVTHHTTDMLIYYGPDHQNPTGVFPLDPGWGSQTDKQGINSMLQHVHRTHGAKILSYHELYSGKPEESSRIAGPRADLLRDLEEDGCTYTDIEHWYDNDPVLVHDGETCPVHEVGRHSDLEPFTPPLTVEDTIG